jgi:NADH-quinone oxidoreductase subunit L
MKIMTAIVPLLPVFGFIILAVFGSRMSRKAVAFTGAGTVGISALLTLIIGITFLNSGPSNSEFTVKLWDWIVTGGFSAAVAFRLDALSLVFMFVITFVGFLIHVYSTAFMEGDDGYSRFFAYMNLFVGSMLILVMADNLLLLYLGWEGVGLCSYLLIGFWYREPENGYAARKAFIVTRIGDTAMIIGLFLLFFQLGTLNIKDLLQQATLKWEPGSSLAIWSAALLLGGALGKSAQLPLQTWLPDAMAGPSPVSALIHAATMVTAGVYLIARTNVIFILAPAVMTAVAVIGALTLLVAGFSALGQHDLKRILAYSTISQIGYMFLALGVGAWSAAIFHFMIHAFFKSLLFLAGGAVILALHEEHDIFKMGGLRHKMPVIYWVFLAGSASLAALPLITAGFYSKDQILWYAWAGSNGSPWLWLAALVGAFITALYTFRLVFVTFFGEAKTLPVREIGKAMKIPMIILAVLSIIAGFVEMPESLGHVTLFSGLIHNVLPFTQTIHHSISEGWFQLIAAIVTLLGVYLAYLLYYKKSEMAMAFEHSRINKFLLSGFGFDFIYNILIIKPIVWLSEIDKKDFTDNFNATLGKAAQLVNGQLSLLQNGKLRWYIVAFAVGILGLITLMITL